MTDAGRPSSQTGARFAWRCLGAPACEPPAPKRGRQRYATSVVCWLCGGDTAGVGWPRHLVAGPKFTNHNLSPAPTSDAVCQACAHFMSTDSWSAYVAGHPDLGLKAGGPISWRYYSHLFSHAGHTCPQRVAWRRLLVAPPAPPFCAVISESGQKNLLFRARVAYSRDTYPLQVEEDSILVQTNELAACFTDFERLYDLGFSKDQIADGRYHPAQTMKAGLARFRAAEDQFAPWRHRAPGYVRLARFCAQRTGETL